MIPEEFDSFSQSEAILDAFIGTIQDSRTFPNANPVPGLIRVYVSDVDTVVNNIFACIIDGMLQSYGSETETTQHWFFHFEDGDNPGTVGVVVRLTRKTYTASASGGSCTPPQASGSYYSILRTWNDEGGDEMAHEAPAYSAFTFTEEEADAEGNWTPPTAGMEVWEQHPRAWPYKRTDVISTVHEFLDIGAPEGTRSFGDDASAVTVDYDSIEDDIDTNEWYEDLGTGMAQSQDSHGIDWTPWFKLTGESLDVPNNAVPRNIPLAGGTSHTINGSGFNFTTSIDFDFVDCTDIVIVSTDQMTCTAPAGGSTGSKNYQVEDKFGQSDFKSFGIRYI